MKVWLLTILCLYLNVMPQNILKSEIPLLVIQTSTPNQENALNIEDIDYLFNHQINAYYSQMTKGHLNFTHSSHWIKQVSLNDAIEYNQSIDAGLRSILNISNFHWKAYDKNQNGYIENNELVVVNILPLKEKYNDPLAGYYPLESFEVEEGLFLEQFIQFGHKEAFKKRVSLLTESTVAHELGHYLGLVDLYDTDLSSRGLGPVSLMSEIHDDKPSQLDPWSKLKLGFQKPIVLFDSGEYPIEENKIYRVNTNNPKVYFLIEYRSLTGYDESLKALGLQEGIYIYKINERVINKNKGLNKVNTNDGDLGVQWMNKEKVMFSGIILEKLTDNILLYRK